MAEMHAFSQAAWIYANVDVCDDQYTEYVDFLPRAAGKTLLHISADSNYAVFINGNYVASGQYGDFEHYKIYDTLDLGAYLTAEKNRMDILLYYVGADNQRYRRGVAGLLYEACCEGRVLSYSGTHTMARRSPAYDSGARRWLTSQLGFTFAYHADRVRDGGYTAARVVKKDVTLFPRPIKKQRVLDRAAMVSVTRLSPTLWQVDLGREIVGFPTLSLFSSVAQQLKISWGESLTSGRVREVIGKRNFSFYYGTRVGENTFTEYMLRISCRYLEISAEAPIDLTYLSVLPEVYEVEDLPYRMALPQDAAIYGISLNTLHLCMMEHYVDTPWREQCLYSFDSRNQMLCGYYALAGGNADYARANLQLMSEDKRPDGLLSICYPCGTALAIPSFSLYYIMAMSEYVQYTGDVTLAQRYLDKIETVLQTFLSNMREGLVHKFCGDSMWNFYDWSPYLDGYDERAKRGEADLVINALFLLALQAYEKITAALAMDFPYRLQASALKARIKEAFLCENGLLSLYQGGNELTVLGNALAVLGGVLTGAEAEAVCDRIVAGIPTPSSLSMNIFKYEALLMTNAAKYREAILREIRESYQKMLDAGSTTVWETLEGAEAFDNAGSLCHGWSAVPIYIYYRLGMVDQGV